MLPQILLKAVIALVICTITIFCIVFWSKNCSPKKMFMFRKIYFYKFFACVFWKEKREEYRYPQLHYYSSKPEELTHNCTHNYSCNYLLVLQILSNYYYLLLCSMSTIQMRHHHKIQKDYWEGWTQIAEGIIHILKIHDCR